MGKLTKEEKAVRLSVEAISAMSGLSHAEVVSAMLFMDVLKNLRRGDIDPTLEKRVELFIRQLMGDDAFEAVYPASSATKLWSN